MIIPEKQAREEILSEIEDMNIERLAAAYSQLLTEKSVSVQADADSCHHSSWYSYGQYVSDFKEGRN